MTLFEIVAFYVALNLILLSILMLRVGTQRVAKKVSLGDGGDGGLFARIRAHANFVETAPFALLGLLAMAQLGAAPIALHIFGAGFTLGRIAHAHGMAQKNSNGKGRVLGALTTLLTFLGSALYILYLIFIG